MAACLTNSPVLPSEIRLMPTPAFSGFQPSLFRFLKTLRANNNRAWFQTNKTRYEEELLAPCQAFIRAFQPALKRVSPHFLADDRRVGGSLMRIYRDTRFGKDKTPYKTNVGIQFRHEMGKDVHCPGFYVHLAPGDCFLGSGIWHPDAAALKRIRHAIDDEPTKWKRARDHKKFRAHFDLVGDSLKTAPRDYPKDHLLIEDLRRKDFIGVKQIREADVLAADFVEATTDAFLTSRVYMRFLCDALRIPS
jgi:uncharacterized protein (TIGR02453 family)